MQHVDAPKAEGFDDDALVAHGGQHVENGRIQSRRELQEEYLLADIGKQLAFAGAPGQHVGVHHQPPVADQSGIAGVDAFKGGKPGSPNLHRPASQHDLPVKGQKHAGCAGGRHGKGGAQVVRAVAEHIRQRQLGTGEHHRNVNIGQHKGHGGGSVGHGVGAMGDHDPVVARPVLKNVPCDQLPFLRPDVGGIQTDHVFHGDIVIGAQLFQLPLHHLGAPGFQPFAAGNGRDGAAGGEKKYPFLSSHWRPRKILDADAQNERKNIPSGAIRYYYTFPWGK